MHGILSDLDLPISVILEGWSFGSGQTERIDHPLVREIELAVEVEMLSGDGGTGANCFDQVLPAFLVLFGSQFAREVDVVA
jgi:hypothetical protein